MLVTGVAHGQSWVSRTIGCLSPLVAMKASSQGRGIQANSQWSCVCVRCVCIECVCPCVYSVLSWSCVYPVVLVETRGQPLRVGSCLLLHWKWHLCCFCVCSRQACSWASGPSRLLFSCAPSARIADHPLRMPSFYLQGCLPGSCVKFSVTEAAGSKVG